MFDQGFLLAMSMPVLLGAVWLATGPARRRRLNADIAIDEANAAATEAYYRAQQRRWEAL